ncbi:hypothetical protein FGO68_gene11643 [Halteria grandinella]|uniref:Uncharacterized protein n=1 Tax=Halteria grandinella TaxID=5974 RepID=A0A8J8SUT4_HALGN|nr:hypothetical protein FGO68_gene11643 [Halteria grandinella]
MYNYHLLVGRRGHFLSLDRLVGSWTWSVAAWIGGQLLVVKLLRQALPMENALTIYFIKYNYNGAQFMFFPLNDYQKQIMAKNTNKRQFLVPEYAQELGYANEFLTGFTDNSILEADATFGTRKYMIELV